MGTANVKRPRIITTTVQYQKEKNHRFSRHNAD